MRRNEVAEKRKKVQTFYGLFVVLSMIKHFQMLAYYLMIMESVMRIQLTDEENSLLKFHN